MESACSMKGPVIDWPSNPSELVRGVNDSWNSYQRAQKGRTVTTAEWKAERETLWQEYEKCMALPPTSTNLPACNASAAGAVDEAVEAETSPCSSSSSAVSKRTKMSSTRGEESYALQAGTKVIGYFRGLKQETGWYGATIADVLVDNDTDGADRIRYMVAWDDGDTRDTHKTSDDIAIVMANLLLNPSLAHLRALPRMSPAIIADLESGLDPGKIVWAGRGKGCWPGRIAWLERAPPQVLLEQKPGMILVHYFDGWADSTRDVQNTPSLWTYSWLKPAQIRDFEGWDSRSAVISGAAAPKTMKKTNPRKPTSPQGDTLLESERADGRYVLDPSKPLTERQQLKLLGVTDITGQDQGPKCKDDNDRILLNVRLMSGSDESGAVRFRLSAKSKLKKLMRSYSEYMGLEEHKLKFSCLGVGLSQSLTPTQLGLQEDDDIDVEIMSTSVEVCDAGAGGKREADKCNVGRGEKRQKRDARERTQTAFYDPEKVDAEHAQRMEACENAQGPRMPLTDDTATKASTRLAILDILQEHGRLDFKNNHTLHAIPVLRAALAAACLPDPGETAEAVLTAVLAGLRNGSLNADGPHDAAIRSALAKEAILQKERTKRRNRKAHRKKTNQMGDTAVPEVGLEKVNTKVSEKTGRWEPKDGKGNDGRDSSRSGKSCRACKQAVCKQAPKCREVAALTLGQGGKESGLVLQTVSVDAAPAVELASPLLPSLSGPSADDAEEENGNAVVESAQHSATPQQPQDSVGAAAWATYKTALQLGIAIDQQHVANGLAWKFPMLPQIGPHDADVLEIFDGQASIPAPGVAPGRTLLDSADAVGGSAATSSLSLQASSISTKLSPAHEDGTRDGARDPGANSAFTVRGEAAALRRLQQLASQASPTSSIATEMKRPQRKNLSDAAADFLDAAADSDVCSVFSSPRVTKKQHDAAEDMAQSGRDEVRN